MPGSRVLYAVAADLDTVTLVTDVTRRVDQAVESLLRSASDAAFDDIGDVTFALRTLLVGTVRAGLENDASAATLAMLRSQLPTMCRAYLSAVARR
jgi:hypothetical protein